MTNTHIPAFLLSCIDEDQRGAYVALCEALNRPVAVERFQAMYLGAISPAEYARAVALETGECDQSLVSFVAWEAVGQRCIAERECFQHGGHLFLCEHRL